jgi:adenylate cyclase
VTRIAQQSGGGFVATSRDRAGATFLAPLVPAGAATDPTAHPTFSTLAAKSRAGRAIWSDLHYAEADAALPTAERRVVLSIQKAVFDAAGTFLGVLRVSLATHELDAIVGKNPSDPDDPHRVVLLSVDGPRVNLVARLGPTDRMTEVDGGLRFTPERPSAELAALLASPLVQGLDAVHPSARGAVTVGGERFLATLRELDLGRGGTTGWMVAVLVPEAHYTRDLARNERTFAVAFAATIALVLLIGIITLAVVRRGLRRILVSTRSMRAFDFAAADSHSVFREVDDVMGGLERAKTVTRAMARYVPLDLVRRLFDENREPTLGGEPVELSLLFTDIEGFTTLAEKLPPDRLAERLGDYLDAMTVAVQATGGTIDKFIGDAVMAFWNAPVPVADHAKQLCRATLDAMEATRKLYASPRWDGLPPLVTRFGLHRTRALVGNFGAPGRLSYTALGDGVNLAARLEPLCKQYGVVTLASEAVVAEARDAFVFRRIDRVAVKGKTQGVEVYELLGAVEDGDRIPRLAEARRYERAFEAYVARNFAAAIELLAPQCDVDPPSAVLRKRCDTYLVKPPPEGWDGVFVASSK